LALLRICASEAILKRPNKIYVEDKQLITLVFRDLCILYLLPFFLVTSSSVANAKQDT